MKNLELDFELYASINHYVSDGAADWDYFCSVNY